MADNLIFPIGFPFRSVSNSFNNFDEEFFTLVVLVRRILCYNRFQKEIHCDCVIPCRIFLVSLISFLFGIA